MNCTGNYKINDNSTLNNVLKITDFNVNLISITKLTKQLRCCFSFHPDHCLIQDSRMNLIIFMGRRTNGLYMLNDGLKREASKSYSVNRNPWASIWHKRLGHPSILRYELIRKMNISIPKIDNVICNDCPMAKHTRFVFLLVILELLKISNYYILTFRAHIKLLPTKATNIF